MFELSMDGALARLTLDRPEARNAIPAGEWGRLAACAREAVAAGARLLLLSGRGSAFCAGADLGDFAEMARDPAAVERFRLAMREGIDGLAALPIATLAVVEGPCFGAGVALAMACDLRLAAPGAAFAITPAKFGIAYPQEDVARLVALVGPGQAARLLLGAASVGAEEAVRIGLAEFGPGEALEPIARSILANSAGSIAALKQGIRLAARGVASDPAQDEAFDALFASADFAERLAAARRPR